MRSIVTEGALRMVGHAPSVSAAPIHLPRETGEDSHR